MNTTLYIAGPLRGYADHNFPAFDLAKRELQELGYRVVSPADLDRACAYKHGDQVDIARCLLRDLAEIAHCHGIALLDGWGASGGVAAETAFGACLGLPIKPLQEWINEAHTR